MLAGAVSAPRYLLVIGIAWEAVNKENRFEICDSDFFQLSRSPSITPNEMEDWLVRKEILELAFPDLSI